MLKTLIFLLSFFSVSTFGAEVSISGHPDYPPIIWESGGTLKGASVELIAIALKNLGHKPILVPLGTWGRAQAEVKGGRVDILLPPYKTPEREKYYSFSEGPLFLDRTVIFMKKGKSIKFKSYKDLRSYDGIAIVNDSFGDKFDKADKKYGLLKRMSKTQQSLEFLLKNRADYLVAGERAVTSLISNLGLDGKFDIHEQVILETGMYSAISKKSSFNNKPFKESFFREISRLIEEDRQKKLLIKALDDYSSEKGLLEQ